MNHIQNLQQTVRNQEHTLGQIQEEVNDFLTFLGSDKFTGVQSDGERKDWIATSDVVIRLREIRNLTMSNIA